MMTISSFSQTHGIKNSILKKQESLALLSFQLLVKDIAIRKKWNEFREDLPVRHVHIPRISTTIETIYQHLHEKHDIIPKQSPLFYFDKISETQNNHYNQRMILDVIHSTLLFIQEVHRLYERNIHQNLADSLENQNDTESDVSAQINYEDEVLNQAALNLIKQFTQKHFYDKTYAQRKWMKRKHEKRISEHAKEFLIPIRDQAYGIIRIEKKEQKTGDAQERAQLAYNIAYFTIGSTKFYFSDQSDMNH